MRSCPSCGGIIGRDCFNPIECAEISRRMDAAKCNCGCDQLLLELDYIRSVDMPHLESKIQEACVIINRLYDIIGNQPISPELTDAEKFIRENYNEPEKETRDVSDPDYLPF